MTIDTKASVVKSCFNCKHLCRQSESWEMPRVAWYECLKRPQNERLKQFPFRKTQCSLWALREPGFLELKP